MTFLSLIRRIIKTHPARTPASFIRHAKLPHPLKKTVFKKEDET